MPSCQVELSPSDFLVTHSTSCSRTHQYAERSVSKWLEPAGFPFRLRLSPLTPPPGSRVLPDSSSSKIRMFPHLVVRHNIERVLVQGEGHVPEDGADAVLHHSQCLIERSSLQSAVHPDLWRQPQRQRDTKVTANVAITKSFQWACSETAFYCIPWCIFLAS